MSMVGFKSKKEQRMLFLDTMCRKRDWKIPSYLDSVPNSSGVSTIEFEPGALSDLQSMWERVVPRNIAYQHDRAWGDGNGFSHVRASLLGPSLAVPFTNKTLALGTWQQIIVVDFDNRPRSRDVVLQIMGE